MDKLPSLYQLSTEVAALLDSDDPEAMDALDALLPQLEHKAANVVRWIEYVADGAAALKAREEAIREERKAREARVERWKQYLVEAMQRVEALKIVDAATGTEIALHKNPPRVVVDDEGAIPAAFWRQPEPPPPAIDKKALAAAIKEHGSVPGAHTEQGWSLKIKG